jgi:excinuclease ABC subunit C
VVLKVPQRGEQRRLLEQATRNAEEALDRRLAEGATQAKLLRESPTCSSWMSRPTASRFTTTATSWAPTCVGAMVVAGPEGFRKNSQYRKFNIKRPETAPATISR